MKEAIKLIQDKIVFYKEQKTQQNHKEFNDRIKDLEVAILILEGTEKLLKIFTKQSIFNNKN
jgi:hypothetical protein